MPATPPDITRPDITRPAKTAGYRPSLLVGSRLGLWLDGRPPFTWLEAERMRYDPQVIMGLRILRAPLYGATWKVEADSAKVEQWVQRQSEAIYRNLLPKVVRAFEYGVDGGELTFAAKRVGAGRTGPLRVHFRDYLNIHPRDLQPYTHRNAPRGGPLVCLQVRNVEGKGSLYLDRRHAFWFRGEAEYGDWWGRPRLAGAYSPWFDKAARHGAMDSARLFYRKCAFRGPSMRYPPGMTDMGSPETGARLVSNQDIAREIVEKFENGGVLALPSVFDEHGNDLWRWEDPKSFSDLAGLLEYPKLLDRQILIGLGIPPELVDAATVGSGYSGRAIPAQVFFSSMDEVVQLILDAIDKQILRWLVRTNFGRQGYAIKPNSLAKLVAEGPPQPGMGAGMPAQPGPGGRLPYEGPRGGRGWLDPRTGKPHYEPRGGARVRLSWSPYQGPKGGRGWVSDRGEVRYQDAAPTAPGDGDPTSLFAHHAAQGVAFEDAALDVNAFHGGLERLAAAHGLPPAEAYKAFAGRLDEIIHSRRAGAKPLSKWGAYQHAMTSVQSDFESRREAAAFADGYWAQPSALRRAAYYLRRADDLDAAHLDADTREAIAGDLASIPPAKLAVHVARAADQYGTDDSRWEIARQAAAAAPAGKPLRFDGARPDRLVVVPKDELNVDQWAGLVAAARVAPGAAVLSDAAMVWPRGSALDKAHDDMAGATGFLLDDADGVASLFGALSTPIQVAERDVPASARNYGKVSGHLNPDAVPDDWDARAVDAYRRVNKDWYVVVRGLGHPDAGSDAGHALVRAGDVPPLARLPEAYWAGYDPAPDYDSGAQDRQQVREGKNAPEVLAQLRGLADDMGRWRTGRDVLRAFAGARGLHRRTGNMARSDAAAHAKATGWAETAGAAVDADAEHHPRGRAAAEAMADALADLAAIDPPDHEYDPDGFDFEPDVSALADAAMSREDRAGELSRLADEYAELMRDVGEASSSVSFAGAAFVKDTLRPALRAVYRAAQAVLTLPAAETSPALRAQAEAANREARRLTGRSTRAIQMSLAAGAAGGATARQLWDATAAPVLVPIGAAT